MRRSILFGFIAAGLIGILALDLRFVRAVDFTAYDAASLIAVIEAANDEIANPGADTIELTDNVLLVARISETAPDGYTGLPIITSTITIHGNDWTIERDTTINPTFRIFEVSASGDLTLNRVTLRGGLSTDGGVLPTAAGGGLYNAGGNVTITNSSLSGNEAAFGAAIYNEFGGNITLEDSLITDNYSHASGGGIENLGNLVVTRTIITHNSAYGLGGGIANAGMLNMTDSSLSDNTVGQDGGGIYNLNSDFMNGQTTITNSSISGNLAGTQTGYGDGGGVFNFENSMMDISDSTIALNRTVAQAQGAGIRNAGTLTLTNVTIIENNADADDDNGEGGGVMDSGELNVSDSFLTGNRADGHGSAITSQSGAIVHNTCISGNQQNVTTVFNTGSDPIDAAGNWWGSASGPSGNASGQGDSVGTNVDYSGHLSAQPVHCISVPRLKNPSSGLIESTQPVLSWNAVSGAIQYQVEFNSSTVTTAQLTYKPPYPLLLGTYTWRVRAGKGLIWGNWSETRYVTIVSPPDAAPTLNFYLVSAPTLTFTWNRVNWATSYNVEVSRNANFTGAPVYTETVSTSFATLIPSDLGIGTFYWHVQATNDITTGSWSPRESFVIDEP